MAVEFDSRRMQEKVIEELCRDDGGCGFESAAIETVSENRCYDDGRDMVRLRTREGEGL